MSKYPVLCDRCISLLKVIMLTGYCIWHTECDNCHHLADCALTRAADPPK